MVHFRSPESSRTACGVRVAIGEGDSAVVVRARGRIRCTDNREDVTCRRCLSSRPDGWTRWKEGD